VADSTCGGRREKQPDTRRGREGVAAQGYETGGFEPSDKVSPLADPSAQRSHYEKDIEELERKGSGQLLSEQSGVSPLADPLDEGSQGGIYWRKDQEWEDINRHPGCSGATDRTVAHSSGQKQRRRMESQPGNCEKENGERADGGLVRSGSILPSNWGDSQLIYCRDGKYRPIPTEPALFPLANGVSNRVGILRGAGNAIVPQVAAEIIKAFMGD